VVVMSEGQEREAARLLALILARSSTPDHRRRSSGGLPVRLGGGLPVRTHQRAKREDRRRGGGSGRSAKTDIGGLS
jgi:hypothetical protein